MRRELGALLALVLAACASPKPATQSTGWDAEFDDDAKSWKEIQAQIPPYPQPANLVPLEVAPGLAHRFYVDTASLSRGDDGVMRYTAVLKAAGGASNVTFEGMRCETREHKVYALGRDDGTWVRARDPKWSRLAFSEATPHRGVLFRDYLCFSRHDLPAVKDVVGALKRGQPLNPIKVRD
jgi:CNP1-like family